MMIQGKIWGYSCPLFNKNNVELHFIKIKKGGYCSKHLHKYKYNQFIVFAGQLKITVWKDYNGSIMEDVTIVGKDQQCIVTPGEYHKFEALEETTALEVYWVELRQDDIVRIDQGGMLNECINVDNERDGTPSKGGDRRAIFIDNQNNPLYNRQYFENESGYSDHP